MPEVGSAFTDCCAGRGCPNCVGYHGEFDPRCPVCGRPIEDDAAACSVACAERIERELPVAA